MKNQQEEASDKVFNRRIIDISIKLSAMAMIILWCLAIVKPFILITIWAAILAVALYPVHIKLTTVLKGNRKLASVVIALVGISLIAVPSINLSYSAIDSAQHVYTGIEEGTLKIPAADESVKEWPVVGEQLFKFWQDASQDIQKLTITHI